MKPDANTRVSRRAHTRHLLIASLLGSLAVAGSSMAQTPQEQIRQRLVDQIRSGETLQRDDLVDDAIQRLYRLDPAAPEGLAAQIGLAVKRNQLDEARKLLKQLQTQRPDSTQARQADTLIRIAEPDGQAALAQARLLASVGRVPEARVRYDGLFKGVYPTIDLAVEYWLLRSREPDSRNEAIRELRQLVAQYPRHPGLLLALANFSFADDQPEQALAYLHTLAGIAGQRENAAAREYDYLASLPTSPAALAAWRDFNERYAGLPIQQRASERMNAQNQLVSDPVWRAGRQAVEWIDQDKPVNQNTLAVLRKAVQAYPNDPAFLGALGLTYLRLNDRAQALRYFQQAKNAEPLVDRASRWVSLIQSTQDWLTLQKADQAAQNGQWDTARALYAQVARTDPGNVFAYIGMGDAALARKDTEQGWGYFRKAFLMEPDNESTRNGLARAIAPLPPEDALARLDSLPKGLQKYVLGLRTALLITQLEAQATKALNLGQPDQAIMLLRQAQSLNLTDPWLSYRLASVLLQQNQPAQALAAYDLHLAHHGNEPASRYAHALLLESTDAWNEALQSLESIPAADWTDDMASLAERVKTRQRIAQAQQLFDAGQTQAAISALEQPPENTVTRLQVADWALQTGDYDRALAYYRAVLRQEPDNVDAQLGELETWLAQGKTETVRSMLARTPPQPATTANTLGLQRRLALLWAAVGERKKAQTLLSEATQQATGPEPLLLRDYARVLAAEEPQKALDTYQKAMVDAGMLAPEHATQPRNNEAFTQAMQFREDPDWLRNSLRSDADTLYQRENTTVQLHNDGWIRNDGTPGISRLQANTTIFQINHPIQNGVGFIRADHIRLDAGTFETNTQGEIEERFGTCIFPGLDAQGTTQSLPGCRNDVRQKANGTSFAVGWQGDRFRFDLGRTPESFPVSNWVGGIGITGDAGQVGWDLALSRRPLSNSLLSLAGATDPRTGIIWGGVLATGATLGLSWDQGGDHGVWSSLGYHKITGTNVAGNHRTRLMGGYYYRLINDTNRLATVGVNAMHWRYQRDLGNYTLGQGGYYSPQRYSSISLPITYAQRTENWSFALRGALTRSVAKSRDESYYPLAGLISGPINVLQRQGVSAAGFQAANISTGGGTSAEWGHSISGTVERRLNSHWVAGAGFDIQRGQDYTPSRFMLYLRYTVEPWRGSLPLNPTQLTPYADFN